MQIFKSSPADVYLLNGGKLARLTVEIELNFWRWRGSFYSGATSLSMSKRQAAPGSAVEGRHRAISAMGLPAGLKTWGCAM